tara:strand:+ start:82 stop:330 length:249 start_codon:yes stop_codon:yes gene_type:complete
MELDLLSGALFLFVNRARKASKALYWDGNGLILFHKKLEKGRFMSFSHLDQITEINLSDLKLILGGAQIPFNHRGKKISLKV